MPTALRFQVQPPPQAVAENSISIKLRPVSRLDNGTAPIHLAGGLPEAGLTYDEYAELLRGLGRVLPKEPFQQVFPGQEVSLLSHAGAAKLLLHESGPELIFDKSTWLTLLEGAKFVVAFGDVVFSVARLLEKRKIQIAEKRTEVDRVDPDFLAVEARTSEGQVLLLLEPLPIDDMSAFKQRLNTQLASQQEWAPPDGVSDLMSYRPSED